MKTVKFSQDDFDMEYDAMLSDLEEVLERVRRGECAGIAWVALLFDSSSVTERADGISQVPELEQDSRVFSASDETMEPLVGGIRELLDEGSEP